MLAKMRSTICFCAALLILIPALAWSQNSAVTAILIKVEPFTPQELIKAMDEHGERAILRYIFENPERLEIALKKFESGDPEWLKLFPRLRGASDAGYSTILNGSVVYGLSKNPEGALAAMYGGNVSPENHCGTVWEAWDEEKPLSQLAPSALREINARIKALQSIPDTNFEYIRTECLKDLERDKAFWENPIEKQ